jgi:hypothetical protein
MNFQTCSSKIPGSSSDGGAVPSPRYASQTRMTVKQKGLRRRAVRAPRPHRATGLEPRATRTSLEPPIILHSSFLQFIIFFRDSR